MIKEKKSLDIKDVIALVAGGVAFGAIAMVNLAKSSVWFDESFGAYLIRFDFAKVFHYTAADVHPPLYYWFLKIWGGIFGNTDFGLRLMSVFFGIITVVFVYLLIRRMFGRKPAIFAMILAVLSPILVRYAQEMRMYTMVTAIAVSATYFLVRAKQEGKRKFWVIYGILVALGMWTHYFMVLIWATHFVWLAIQARPKQKPWRKWWGRLFTKEVIIGYVVAFVVFLPWLPSFVKQVSIVQTAGFWIPPVNLNTITNYLSNTVFYVDASTISPLLALLFVVLFIVCVWLMPMVYRKLDDDGKKKYLLVVLLTFLPMLILMALSLPPLQSSFVGRYLVVSSMMLAVLIGMSVAMMGGKKVWRGSLLAAFIVVSCIGVSNVYYYGNYNKENGNQSGAKQLIVRVVEESKGSEPVVSASEWLFYDAVFYESDEHQVYYVDKLVNYIYGSLTVLCDEDVDKIKDFDEFLKKYDRFWWIGNLDSAEFRWTGNSDSDDASALLKSGWEVGREIVTNDPFLNEPAYKAILYQRVSE